MISWYVWTKLRFNGSQSTSVSKDPEKEKALVTPLLTFEWKESPGINRNDCEYKEKSDGMNSMQDIQARYGIMHSEIDYLSTSSIYSHGSNAFLSSFASE